MNGISLANFRRGENGPKRVVVVQYQMARHITLRLLVPAAFGGLHPNRPTAGWSLGQEVLEWTYAAPGNGLKGPVQQPPGRYLTARDREPVYGPF